MKNLLVVSAGLSEPSTTHQIAETISTAVATHVHTRGESLGVTSLKLRELAEDLAHQTVTGMSTPRLDEVKQQVSSADALIAVTPVYKASYSGLFKMFFDVLDPDALNGMPTIIAATAGSLRHSLVTEYAMRPLLSYMRAVVVPTALFFATEDFGSTAGEAFTQRADRAAGELAALITAVETTESSADDATGAGRLPNTRRRFAGVDLEDEFVPFSALLHGHTGE